ncbi:MAG: PAS domain-containing protein [Desulfobacter sp.]|nr:MAG: PAS domain-containing protein [Desulfobacter sp.]
MKRLNKITGNLVSPLMMVGVLAVLLPVFTFMTLDRVGRQKEHLREQMRVRGMALIRTFEAGTRTGMLSMGWGMRRIQSMLAETAVQPDIAYIMITDSQGTILAHSDPERVGEVYGGWADLAVLPGEPAEVFNRTRQVAGEPVLEVYKLFVPLRMGFRGKHPGGHPMHGGRHAMAGGPELEPAPDHMNHRTFRLKEHFIFAGLSMARAEKIEKRMARSIIGRGILFFVLGCAGIISLFAFQAYRSARASLDRVKAFSDNVVQNMPSGLLTLDGEYRVTSANRAAGDILGRIPETAYPQMIRLASQLSGPGAPATGEVALNSQEKGELRLDMTASPILSDEGEVQGYIFLFRDMTQLRELKKEVETNRRLAAIGKLAGGVAHEIRNPLSSIKGFATYFAKRYENEPGDAETARIMVQEVERINRSITQLLEFAKPLAVEIRPVEIEPLIRHSLMLVSHDLEKKNIQAHVEIKTDLELLATDPDRINQVLLNLYMNGVNAMSKGGELWVTLSDRADKTGRDDKTGVEIEVRDTGCGIDPEDMDRIFDPYFTTRPQGTGLGLSIVHRIIENLKGEIRVDSEPGRGTTFTISLPLLGRENKKTPNEEGQTR